MKLQEIFNAKVDYDYNNKKIYKYRIVEILQRFFKYVGKIELLKKLE